MYNIYPVKDFATIFNCTVDSPGPDTCHNIELYYTKYDSKCPLYILILQESFAAFYVSQHALLVK